MSALPKRLVQPSIDAQFVFTGRVEALGRNNLEGMPAAGNHAIVRVLDVLLSPSSLGELRGRSVTVVLSTKAAVGSIATFWARNWVIGRELGVIELARQAGKAKLEVKSELVDIRLRALDAKISERLKKASAVVAGTVIHLKEVGVTPEGEGTFWWLAPIRVSATIAGVGDAEMQILFPGMGGPRWRLAPRFVLGQEAVWILRAVPEDLPAGKLTDAVAFIALEPEDVHAPSDAARLEALASLSFKPQRSRK